MRVIVAGSRHFGDYEFVRHHLDSMPWSPTKVLSGDCRGVDQLGARWAAENDYPVERHPAQFQLLGPKAGPIRNRKMAQRADALIAFWDGRKKGSGTWNMIQQAGEHGLFVLIVDLPAR